MIPLSALNQFLFCARRAALIHVEGIFKDNQHTLRGDIVHEHSDLAGYEVVKGATLLRALPVWSERLGLNGKCDIVESRTDGSLFPVEFKLGKRRQWENDDAQLCAQALCLEEMFNVSIPRGAVFHADSKRRREVEDADGSYVGSLVAQPEQSGKLEFKELRTALEKLPSDQREALILVGASGFSYEEAAAICGCAVGTIKSRVNRARTRLAQELNIDNAEDFGPDRNTRAVMAASDRR